MLEHSSDVIALLLWMIVGVGGLLVALIAWLGQRLYAYIEKIPSVIAEKVKQVHDDLLLQVRDLRETQKKLEQDLRGTTADLDRRVIKLEVRDEARNGRGKEAA